MSIDSKADGWTKALGFDRKHFNLFFDRMMDGFAFHKIVVDKTGKPIDYIFLEVNSAFEKFTGLKRDKIIGKKVTEVLKGIENDPADWIGRYGKVALTGEPVQFENFAEPLGKWFNVSSYCPKKGYFVAIFEDITGRKNAEAALRVGEENYRHLMQNAPTAIYEIDYKTSRFKSVNDAVSVLTGYSREELLAMNAAELLDPESRVRFQDRIKKALAGEKIDENVEYKAVVKGGRELWVVLNVKLTSKDGNFVGALVVGHDITERKQAEIALRKAKEQADLERKRLETILETSPSAVVILDAPDGNFSFVNKRAKQLYGFDTLGLDLAENVAKVKAKRADGTDYPIEEMPVSRTFKFGQEVHNEEMMIERADGKAFPIIASTAPLRDLQGNITAAIVVFEDITERKKNEKENARLASFPTFNPNAIFEVDFNGKITYANPATKMLFPTLEKLGLKHPLLSDWQKITKNFENNDVTGLGRETKVNEHWYQQQLYLVPESHLIRIYMADIDDLKKTEEVLGKLNRHLRAISNSNQALLRASDELEFTQEVCNIVIKDCGYALVWVGFAENDKEKTVKPVAFAGFDKGYINSLRITWDENSERGRGPTGQTIRTGKPYVCNMKCDLNFKPWLKEADKRGYAASLVLPLTTFEGETFGALNIYSQQSNSFTDEEIKLLSELSNDFAYGIVMLRLRKKREEAEEALRESEKQLQNIIDGSPSFIFLKDKDGRFITVNERLEESLEMKREEVRGKTDYDIFPKAVADSYRKNDRQVLETKKPIQTEEIFDSPDGKKYTLLANKFPLFNSSGEVIATCGISTDITERKQMQEKLEEYARNLEGLVEERTKKLEASALYARGLIEASLDPLVTINAEGKITDVNQATETVTGCSREELIGTDFSDYFVQPEEARKGYLQVFQEGYVRDYPLSIRNKSGKITEVLYNATLFKNKAGKVEGIFAAARDMTEHKKAEQAFLNERKRLFDVLETLPAMVCLLTPDYHVDFANRSFREKFGNSEGRCCYDYCFGNKEPCSFCESYTPLKTGKPHHWEVNGSDGSVIDAYDFPFTDVDGSKKILEMDIDITERKKMEKQLKDSERLAAIGATAGMVGHDIRNPLQAITGDVFLAKSDLEAIPEGSDKEEIRESLESIDKNVEYINKIVQDLQDFARPLNPKSEESDLKLVVEGLFAKNDVPTNIKVKLKIAEEARKITADAYYLNRILFNLVTNAVQAMPNGGKLTIQAYREANDTFLTVKDTGVGIPKSIRDKMFTLMFTTKSKGQGFGLPVVKRMAESLGGTVTFRSQEGKGTTFIVRLPSAKKKR